MTFAMILDLVVVVLLVPTIIFAVILNNRLSVLRRNREELARLIAAFNEATVRAESGIPRLRKTSEDASRALQEKVERAQLLRDDLAFMIERAEGMAGRLEGMVRDVRTENTRMPPARSMPSPHGLDIESVAEAAERAERVLGDRDRSGSERMGSERMGIDRSALEKMVEERGGILGEDRPRRPPVDRSPPQEPRLGDRPRPALPADDLPPEHALAERILAEQAGQDFSAPLEPRRARDPMAALPPPRPARAPQGTSPERTLGERPLGERPLGERPLGERPADSEPRERPPTRTASGTRPSDRPAPASTSRVTRPGQVLGNALAEEAQNKPVPTPAPTAAPARSAPRPPPVTAAPASIAAKDDDDRSEAERELLRALRSAR
ncbi:DUF6468 domain-containing protein [Insolitispirillum peregrinum]|uniref:DUF6468 domain-containing protein n=1 Tax=Insolitispirillum peregrinum TaxID=80876 RepID=UPI00360E1795